jgi:hypothetical protein
MRIQSYIISATLLAGLTACNENEQSGFSGGRKAKAEEKQGTDQGGDGEDDNDGKNSDEDDKIDDNGLDSDADIEADTGDNDSDLQNGGVKGDTIEIDENEIVAKIPGVEVIRVGVNFEDLGFSSKSDNDYNDAVLCFEGKFKVENTDVVSIKAQTVTGKTFSGSGCNHKVRVEIIHSDGSKEPNIEFDSRDTNPVQMQFKTGSKLEVYMTPYKGCNEGVVRNMHQSQHAIVKPNVCNNSGG